MRRVERNEDGAGRVERKEERNRSEVRMQEEAWRVERMQERWES